jgi:phospholipid/cholesterol/gamma-HCH transport system substrate-binding protein
MDERLIQFRVGVMVLATLLFGGILVGVLGEMPKFVLGQRTYPIEMDFPRAPGVAKETPVRKSGILIGRVSDVRFNDDGTVVLTAAIQDHVKLTRAERPQIRGGILGDAVIEFVMADAPADRTPLAPGDRVKNGIVVSDPAEVLTDIKGDLQIAMRVFTDSGRDIGKLAKSLDRVLTENDEQIQRVLDETEKALGSFNKAMKAIDRIAGDEKIQEQLRKSLEDLPATLEQSRKTFDRIQNTIQLVDTNLENLTKFTGPLGERGDEMVGRISGSVGRLEQLLTQMVGLSEKLTTDEGSLGQFLNNPDLYQSMLRASRNVEEATRRLRPIVEDVRVLSDKMARDPAMILREAVKPPAGIK